MVGVRVGAGGGGWGGGGGGGAAVSVVGEIGCDEGRGDGEREAAWMALFALG
eukprot:COSAG06_NODE_55589_length_289_cov_0.236842_1_plen_51_part_01